ncbi:hypothetical protein B0H16DRAFT_1702585, partial [Mycena metata]
MSFPSILFLNILNLQRFVQHRSMPPRGRPHVRSRSRHVVLSLGGRTYGSLTARVHWASLNLRHGALLRVFEPRLTETMDVWVQVYRYYERGLIYLNLPQALKSMFVQHNFNMTSTFDDPTSGISGMRPALVHFELNRLRSKWSRHLGSDSNVSAVECLRHWNGLTDRPSTPALASKFESVHRPD